MKTSIEKTPRQKRIESRQINKTAKTIRALRELKNLSRAEAGQMIGVSIKSFDQIENGRCLMSESRIRKYVTGMGYSMTEFHQTKNSIDDVFKQLERNKHYQKAKKTPKLRRNFYKIISKETRIIRILRRKKGLTQYQASDQCGYANSIFGQIENGRIELPRERIKHIVRSIGWTIKDFDGLMKAEVLRDEIIEECRKYLEGLEDSKLESAKLVIMSLLK